MSLLKNKKIITIEKDRKGQMYIKTDGLMDATKVADYLLGALILTAKHLMERNPLMDKDLIIQLVTSELEKNLKN